jgi:hypothetical protein
MATTTNYGWTTPDDTALVKDGAAAIRTLGSSIDTTLKTQIDAQIPDSLLTTKGDIIAATGASTPSRLGVGTNGQALIADSTAATGMKWDTPSAGGMTLISTTTLSGASVTLSSIPSTYVNLVVIIQNLRPASDQEQFKMRFNADSTATRHYSVNGLSANNIPFDSNDATVTPTLDNTVAQGLIYMDIPSYANTTTWKMFRAQSFVNNATTATSMNSFNLSTGFYNQTSAISSLQFLMSSGNFTSGTVLLYGVK